MGVTGAKMEKQIFKIAPIVNGSLSAAKIILGPLWC
jgi:hypothetical protein